MKGTALALGLCLVTGLQAFATSPIASHPPAPAITAIRAITVAEKFAATTTSIRYCSSVSLVEGQVIPAPHGSARHWLITFQDVGADRVARTRVYVDMKGKASDVIPPAYRKTAEPKDAGDKK